jgi:hypothetical protein
MVANRSLQSCIADRLTLNATATHVRHGFAFQQVRNDGLFSHVQTGQQGLPVQLACRDQGGVFLIPREHIMEDEDLTLGFFIDGGRFIQGTEPGTAV